MPSAHARRVVHHQFRHGQPDGGHGGPVLGDHAQGVVFPSVAHGLKRQEPPGDLISADRRGAGEGIVHRPLPAGSAGAASVHPAARCRPPSATTTATTSGPTVTPPTDAEPRRGSSVLICARRAAWPSTWRRLHPSSVGFSTRSDRRAVAGVDQPMIPEGVKTEESDRKVTGESVEAQIRHRHRRAGRKSATRAKPVKHLRF